MPDTTNPVLWCAHEGCPRRHTYEGKKPQGNGQALIYACDVCQAERVWGVEALFAVAYAARLGSEAA